MPRVGRGEANACNMLVRFFSIGRVAGKKLGDCWTNARTLLGRTTRPIFAKSDQFCPTLANIGPICAHSRQKLANIGRIVQPAPRKRSTTIVWASFEHFSSCPVRRTGIWRAYFEDLFAMPAARRMSIFQHLLYMGRCEGALVCLPAATLEGTYPSRAQSYVRHELGRHSASA